MNHPPTGTPVSAPHDAIPWHQQLRRSQIVQSLEAVQDLIAISLCLGLFGVMVLQLKRTFSTLFSASEFHEVTADILFILILVELFRLLIIYLQEQRVSIGVAVEIAIVSVLREVIVRGVLETDWQQILAVCLFLMTMALLMVVRVWLPPTFAGVDPEAQVSARMRQVQEHGEGSNSLAAPSFATSKSAIDQAV
ncbi:phosphate-starvation-inducible PsiE family protein [Synechococcus sp. CCAP 1479/9]|uniref:phosphate-starvation-inducible PsiE family protein n=1 Tax=Synechococcus sp. CCAP 1479/9 TaxID=1221593 RepID=UPI001C2501FE|nr:phosphate-starvation-inducible PsiE family protein [Synechococcus sp. CCAP 1479/9]